LGYRRLIDCDALFEDDQLFEAIGNEGVLLYIRLWSLAECWGGLEDNPKSIARQSGALNLSTKKIEKIIQKLVEMGKIYRYFHQEKPFLWLKNLKKHQNLKKVPQSKIPIPNFIHSEEHNYESKKVYSYSVLEHLTPDKQNVGRNSEESLANVPRRTHSITEHKHNITKQRADHRQTIPEQNSPLTGDDLFFNFLERFSSKTCDDCQGEGRRGEAPCSCVITYIRDMAEASLDGGFPTIARKANPTCKQCLGFGVVFSGDRENTKAKSQCDCTKRPIQVA